MTLEGWVKEYIETRYPGCFDFVGPGKDLGLLVVDMMQWVKGALPGDDFIKTERQVVNYFKNKISGLFDKGASTVVICFDKASPETKKIVCHRWRNERRCKKCKLKPELPRGATAGAEYFDPNCEKGCIGKQIYWREEGPHMHVDDSHPIDPDWSRFCADSRNLLHELYPRIANALLEWCPRRPGQMLFVEGLPFKQREVREYEQDFDSHKGFVNKAKMRVVLEPWSYESDLPLPLDTPVFNKTYVIENCGTHVRRQEVPEMQNDIHEADNAIFYYSQFFPNHYKQMVYINDGDAISIGLLRALEDFRGPDNYAHELWLCMPYRSKKKRALFTGKPPTVQYINLTKLCQRVDETPEYIQAHVQSPIATLVFLIILSNTDFFKGEFCYGIGKLTVPNEDAAKREKQTKGVWDTFFDKLPMYSHMVQYYPNKKSLTEQRRIVIDEDLFKIFTQDCYLNKYGDAAAKKHKKTNSTYDLVKLHCSSLKDKRKHPPNDMVIQRWSRQIAWNLNYWANAFRNIYIDPFEEYNNQSYWGYDRKNMVITNVIASKQKPLDEVYKRNFWKRRQKPGEVPMEPIPEKKKQDALNLIRGK